MNKAIFNLKDCSIRIEKGLIIIQSNKPLSHVPEEFWPFDSIEDKGIDDLISQIINKPTTNNVSDLPKFIDKNDFFYVTDEELLSVLEDMSEIKKSSKSKPTMFNNFNIISPEDF